MLTGRIRLPSQAAAGRGYPWVDAGWVSGLGRNKKEGGNTGLSQTSKGHIQARDFTVQVRRCQRRVLSRVVTL